MMTAESMLSKRPALTISVASFFLDLFLVSSFSKANYFPPLFCYIFEAWQQPVLMIFSLTYIFFVGATTKPGKFGVTEGEGSLSFLTHEDVFRSIKVRPLIFQTQS